MKTQKQISAAVVYRISDKSGKCLGYLVPSDTEGVAPYEVTYNYSTHRYECNCKCGIECNHTKECKHIRAVKEVCEIRNQVVSTPLTTVMEQAHDAMVAFDRDSDPNAYEVLGPDTAQRIEAVREQTREEHLDEDRAYRMAQIEQAMAERKVDGLGYRHEWYPRTSL